ncbi:uncharacterized protein CANTADRAFT_20919 [Suhomyces tanzawaensis NRRL Y-17324]|uniref:Subtelomeric hrmA-associated cluster protein AFUB-079030/YDR124W-like helical bundle domain-containing protein n=1 Tax=Suhomyces tanzawaensis NRRL Y-17324 TaxID=984487 RepID=A0A1E4SJD0_9ASCO|nr:uncharacterized protein CANTADRAFT_20919 [Suhomyces tanzawaensis NRRL Y-17324]ODV79616.1 hypothetical protein CANTADRAFT_20919 [Suhomyces tanzawaensis NRRL Y-17324]
MEKSSECFWGVIADLLTVCSQRDGVEYMLVTKHRDKGLDFLYSSGFTATNKDKIEDLLQEYTGGSLSTIKPALLKQYMLELSRTSNQELYTQYYNLLSCVSQIACKEIAKKWIKVVEPKKQKMYPYKDHNVSKPPWWPHNVDHIEPDHLEKDGRIQLLIRILRDPTIPIESLKLQTTHLNFKFPIVQRLLSEIYYLAFWDRAFYGYCSGSTHYKTPLVGQDLVFINVSNLRESELKPGILRVSQIVPSELNSAIYDVQGCLPVVGQLEVRTPTTKPPEVEPLAKKRRLSATPLKASTNVDCFSDVSSLGDSVNYYYNNATYLQPIKMECTELTFPRLYPPDQTESDYVPFLYLP